MPAVPARAPQAEPQGNPVAGLAFATQTAEVLRPRMKITNGRLIAPGGTPKDVERETMIRHFAAQGIDIRKLTPQQAATLEKEWYAYRAESPATQQPSAYAGPDVPESSPAAGKSAPMEGESFAAVKPKPASNTTPGTIGSTGADRIIAKSAAAVPYGVTEGNNGTMDGPSVPTRTLTGPFNDTSLPMGVRMQSWNDATTANSPRATGRTNQRNVINTGPGQTFNEGMKATGAPMTPEGKLLNPGKDMAAGMTYTKPDGTVLTYTRPDAGKGGPAPMRLTSATRGPGTTIEQNDSSTTGADVRVNRGNGTTDIYDLGAQIGGTGAYRGSISQDSVGRRQVTDASGKTVGRSVNYAFDPAVKAAAATGDVAAIEKATIAERDKRRVIAKAAKQPAAKPVPGINHDWKSLQAA